nr:glycine-rich RNA-binding protein 10-like [Coffea arabica]
MVARMGASVEVLMEQSQHFDGLLLEAFESGSEPQVIAKLFGEMFNQVLKSIWAWLFTENISNIGIYGEDEEDTRAAKLSRAGVQLSGLILADICDGIGYGSVDGNSGGYGTRSRGSNDGSGYGSVGGNDDGSGGGGGPSSKYSPGGGGNGGGWNDGSYGPGANYLRPK